MNEIAIDKLLERNNRINGDEAQRPAPERNISEDTFNCAKKLINMIEERNHIELLMKAQLFLFVFGRILQAKICVEKAKETASSCFDKLAVYRLEVKIRNKI
jgi:hypothetical protein